MALNINFKVLFDNMSLGRNMRESGEGNITKAYITSDETSC
jgi:hypothetical protein